MWPFKKKEKVVNTIGCDVIGDLLVLTGASGMHSTAILEHKGFQGKTLQLNILYYECYKNRIAALAGHDRAVMMARDMIEQNNENRIN